MTVFVRPHRMCVCVCMYAYVCMLCVTRHKRRGLGGRIAMTIMRSYLIATRQHSPCDITMADGNF